VYHVLKHSNVCSIPPEGLAMLRFYPLEPWHAGGAYTKLCTQQDKLHLESVRRFDQSRRATLRSVTHRHRAVDVDAELIKLRPLVNHYVPGALIW
jgi:Myo-inositol oxygenase